MKRQKCFAMTGVANLPCYVCGQPMYPGESVVHCCVDDALSEDFHHAACCGAPDPRAEAFLRASDDLPEAS